jgi:hypothetical protein
MNSFDQATHQQLEHMAAVIEIYYYYTTISITSRMVVCAPSVKMHFSALGEILRMP